MVYVDNYLNAVTVEKIYVEPYDSKCIVIYDEKNKLHFGVVYRFPK